MPITQLPIRLLPGRSHGWRDIGVFVRGGGILPGYHARLSFDGRAYPSNPLMPPARRLRAAGPGRILISDATPTRALFD